jgi:AcrR family transcriptional regulator
LAASKEDAMRDFILQNFEEIFSINGYKNTSMQMIAKKCGISKPTLYNYFSNKYALFTGLWQRFQKDIAALTNGLMANSTDKYKTIEDIIDLSLSLVQQKRDFLRMIIREHHMILHENIDEHLSLQMRNRHDMVMALGRFIKDIVRKDILADFSEEMIGTIVSNVLESAFLESVLGEGIDHDVQKKLIMKLLKHGILA